MDFKNLNNHDNHFNFSGGPGALPESMLNATQAAIMNVPEVGLSLLSISHRSNWLRNVLDETEENFRNLLSIPKNYHVLFLQGGSTEVEPLSAFMVDFKQRYG